MLTFALLFVISALGTAWVRRWVLAKGIIDRPNARSSHLIPTPRGGGIGFALPFLGYSGWLWGNDGLLAEPHGWALIGGAGGIALLGFWDDLRNLSARLRFGLQMLIVAWVLFWVGDLWLYQLFPVAALGVVLAALAMLWWLNLYNFMDGIDGIAAVEGISIAAGALVVLSLGDGNEAVTSLLLALVACTAGFLVFNWPPAKIFMGDVGSCFIGMVIAVLALITVQAQSMSLWSWVILTALFWSDATVTLLRRMLRGEVWHQAHRSHAYQILARRTGSHQKVTLLAALINVGYLLPLAVAENYFPDYGLLFALCACIPLLSATYLVGAGR